MLEKTTKIGFARLRERIRTLYIAPFIDDCIEMRMRTPSIMAAKKVLLEQITLGKEAQNFLRNNPETQMFSAEESHLKEIIKSGKRAQEKMLQLLVPAILCYALNKYAIDEQSLEDFIQDCISELQDVITRKQPSSYGAFNASIYKHIDDIATAYIAEGIQPIQLQEYCARDFTLESVSDEMFVEDLMSVIRNLAEDEQKILFYKHFYNGEGTSFRFAGEVMGMSVPQAQLAYRTALRHLRHPNSSQRLRDYCYI